MLENGADVNAVDMFGMTPLMQAATYNSNPKILRTLIENGADVAAKNKEGKTALDYAERNEKLKGTDAYNLLREKTLSETK